jgi:virulence-associated protein VagC
VKVRIKETPREAELDGVRLDTFKPGTVRDVSPILGSWLIAERYADPEMRRQSVGDREEDFSTVQQIRGRDTAHDHPRRRSDD